MLREASNVLNSYISSVLFKTSSLSDRKADLIKLCSLILAEYEQIITEEYTANRTTGKAERACVKNHKCKQCNNVSAECWRYPDSDFPSDIRYICTICNHSWWIDGADS